ncbi:MAG: DUF2384 domain-containing protein [Elusimicrobia bacterium]|nr:DUF2384 domain-containing protein [Elusimicrobiota bacterium]
MKTRKKTVRRMAEATGPLERGAVVGDVERIRQGFSWGLAHRYQTDMAFKDPEFASFLGVSSRTLGRHRKGSRPLDAVASDRLYRIMRVVALSGKVFEDAELGLRWLRKPQPGLGGRVPVELLDTEPGFEAVEALLQRIEYGAIA